MTNGDLVPHLRTEVGPFLVLEWDDWLSQSWPCHSRPYMSKGKSLLYLQHIGYRCLIRSVWQERKIPIP